MKKIICSKLITTFKNGNATVLSNQVIETDNNRFRSIKPLKDYDPLELKGEEVLHFDGENTFVLPGLIDTHLHLAHSGTNIAEKSDPDPLVAMRMAHNAYLNLKAGITTARDMGAKNHIDVFFKKGLELNLLPAPRILISGQPIIATGGHCYYMGREADGPHEIMKAVREQVKAGVDFIKLMVTGGVMTPGGSIDTQQLTNSEIEAAIGLAHQLGKPTAAHAQGGPGVKQCIKSGIDSLEHGIVLSEDDVDLMLKHDTYYIPTLTAIKEIAEKGVKFGLPDWAIKKASNAVENHRYSYQMARKAGVTIAAGTDYRHGTLLNELKLMQEYGASALEALEAATHSAAKAIQKADDLGTIQSGKLADLTVVKGNPIDNLDVLGAVEAVVVGGSQIWPLTD
jgi:imidazolonepropionase-like amidohydrolase